MTLIAKYDPANLRYESLALERLLAEAIRDERKAAARVALLRSQCLAADRAATEAEIRAKLAATKGEG